MICEMQAEIFVPSEQGGLWTCPFCESPEYTLKLPAKDKILQVNHCYRLISSHLQVHREHVLKALSSKEKAQVTRVRSFFVIKRK